MSHMAIYSGNSLAECTAPLPPLSRLPSLTCTGVDILRSGERTTGVAVTLEPNMGEIARSSYPAKSLHSDLLKRAIRFGDSVQDVMSAVGAPSRIFYKSEDKMKIHSPNAHRKSASLKSDYFYNYFTMGLVI